MCYFGGTPKKTLQLEGPKGIPELKEDSDISFGVIGWKKWNVQYAYPTTTDGLGHLRGGYSIEWKPDEIMRDTTAVRRAGYGRASGIAVGNGVGIYAYKKEERVVVKTPSCVWGEVLLWGKVFEYGGYPSGGYRAQFAYPLSLFCYPERAEILRPWAERGVYVNVYSPETPGCDEYGYIEYSYAKKRERAVAGRG